MKAITGFLDLERSLIFAVLTSMLFAALALFLVFDPVIATVPDPANVRTAIGSWWDEDSIIEYLTAGLAAFAAIAWLCAMSHAKTRSILSKKLDYVLTALMVLMMLFLAGEEISWAQRIVDIETPDYLKQTNLQQELNIHNLDSRIPVQYFLYFGTLAWGVLLPLLRASSRFVRRLAWIFRCPVPPVCLVSLFVGAPLFRIAFISSYGNFAREGMELILAAAFLAVALYAVYKPEEIWVRPADDEG